MGRVPNANTAKHELLEFSMLLSIALFSLKCEMNRVNFAFCSVQFTAGQYTFILCSLKFTPVKCSLKFTAVQWCAVFRLGVTVIRVQFGR